MEALNITTHKDGTYTLSHLTFDEINFIQSALFHNWQTLNAEKNSGKHFNEFCEASLNFCDKASNDLTYIMTK